MGTKPKLTEARRVLVCGGRDYADRKRLFSVLDALHAEEDDKTKRPIAVLIQGGAPGADSLAKAWSWGRKIHCDTYWADWKGLGRYAGPSRNDLMLALGKPDLVVAFEGGAGTGNMVRKARAAGVEVVEV